MSKALDGEHYCKAHQGNYSHYAEHNCTVCKLKQQRDALLAALEKIKLATGDEWVREQCRAAIAAAEGGE